MELARIMERYYPAARLDRKQWRRFQQDVHQIYDRLVMPLLGGVNPPVEIEVLGAGTWGHGTCQHANQYYICVIPY